MRRKLRPVVPKEKTVQAAVKRLFDTVGISYFDTSQPFRAAITPGVPDLICFGNVVGHFYVEVKRPGGKQSPAQRGFGVLCERANVPYIVGGLDEVVAFLTVKGVPTR